MSQYQRMTETPSSTPIPEVGGGATPAEPPPSYEASTVAAAAPAAPSALTVAPPPSGGDKVTYEPPPAYDDGSGATKPPSYAEVEQEKAREVVGLPPVLPAGGGAEAADDAAERENALHLWRISTVSLDPEAAAALKDEQLLGTDLMFCTAFLAAFLFNWIGFLLLLCFCHSVAGRYGALAGFGLSLAKWTLIVKNSTMLVSSDNTWLWWLIMAFGLVIAVRAVLQYLYIKREWRQLSAAARHRLIFFY